MKSSDPTGGLPKPHPILGALTVAAFVRTFPVGRNGSMPCSTYEDIKAKTSSAAGRRSRARTAVGGSGIPAQSKVSLEGGEHVGVCAHCDDPVLGHTACAAACRGAPGSRGWHARCWQPSTQRRGTPALAAVVAAAQARGQTRFVLSVSRVRGEQLCENGCRRGSFGCTADVALKRGRYRGTDLRSRMG